MFSLLKRRTWVSNADRQKLVDDIADNLDGVVARLVADWIPDK